jgi:hypothetical protein
MSQYESQENMQNTAENNAFGKLAEELYYHNSDVSFCTKTTKL